MSKFLNFIEGLTKPRSESEELQRRELIFNVIILPSILLSGVGLIGVVFYEIVLPGNGGTPWYIVALIFLAFLGLYILSRHRFFKVAAYILIALYMLWAIYSLCIWGVDLPQGLLVFSLVIVSAGILIGTFGAFLTTFSLTLALIFIALFQSNGIIHVRSYWRSANFELADVMPFILIYVIILLISWLYNREIESSLRKVKESEKALRIERDSLEVKVEERTKELKKAQLEKIVELSRFATFGRMATGLFHDLVSPLSAISLYLEQLKTEKADPARLETNLKQILSANQRLQKFIDAVRRQIQNQEVETDFQLKESINQALEIYSYKAKSADVDLEFNSQGGVMIHGNPLKFHQCITNLISNAIDAYPKGSENRRVKIELNQREKSAVLTVRDWGVGIPLENIDRIFEPYYTTKGIDKGIGMGLATTKDIVESDFGGEINVKSTKGEGTVFSIEIPLENKSAELNA